MIIITLFTNYWVINAWLSNKYIVDNIELYYWRVSFSYIINFVIINIYFIIKAHNLFFAWDPKISDSALPFLNNQLLDERMNYLNTYFYNIGWLISISLLLSNTPFRSVYFSIYIFHTYQDNILIFNIFNCVWLKIMKIWYL